MRKIALAERRKKQRFDVDGLLVSVRRKGRLARLVGIAEDFNRHGLALITDQPLAKDGLVYLTITASDSKIDNIIGIVHTCISQDVGYRCGIQFRTTSPLQDNRSQIEQRLTELEASFARSSAIS